MENSQDKPQQNSAQSSAESARAAKAAKTQEYYDSIKRKFAEERDLRLSYRPEGTAQYTSDLDGPLARYAVDTFGTEVKPRDAINDTVEVLFIGEDSLRC